MKQISLKETIAMLDAGKSRKEINEYYELNPREAKALWQNEKLKNKKPSKYTIGFELSDDTIEVNYGEELPKTINPSATTILSDKSFE